MSDTGNSLSSTAITKWDGRNETAGRYISQFEAIAEFYDCGDALDEMAMADCPTKSEYRALNLTQDEGKRLAKLYKANAKMSATFSLGQLSDHGLDYINKTKTDDHPQGLVWKALAALKEVFQSPSVKTSTDLKWAD